MEDRDTLKPKRVIKETGWSRQYVQFLQSIPELWGLVQEAVDGDWFDTATGQKMFQNRFESSDWFMQNSKSARGYLIAQAQGGEDYERKVETTRNAIRDRAILLGAEVDDDTLDALTEAYFMNGWGEEGRTGMLDKALTGQLEGFSVNHLNFKAGGPDAIITQLKADARANGLAYSDSYFQTAATNILGGEQTLQDVIASQRQLAATTDPLNAARILAGESRRDIYSPYISTYAKMFDVDPNNVSLDDPNLKLAFNSYDDKGNPAPMGLWDYEKSLRKTEDWQYTREAHDKVSRIVGKIGAMMGFGGSY